MQGFPGASLGLFWKCRVLERKPRLLVAAGAKPRPPHSSSCIAATYCHQCGVSHQHLLPCNGFPCCHVCCQTGKFALEFSCSLSSCPQSLPTIGDTITSALFCNIMAYCGTRLKFTHIEKATCSSNLCIVIYCTTGGKVICTYIFWLLQHDTFGSN